MTPHYSDPLVTLLHGECIEVMATLPADSVDAVVTDPPYALDFMSKQWDSFGTKARRDVAREKHGQAHGNSFYRPGWGQTNTRASMTAFQAWCEQWGREALRVTKPGGYLLSFGGTRTHHRLVCALEDAGWIIRDELDWIYASGFPKGKANLKPAHEPIVLARKPGPLRPLAIDESRIGYEPNPRHEKGGSYAVRVNKTAFFGADADDATVPDLAGRWPSNVLLSDPELFDEPNPYVLGSGATDAGGGYGVRGGRIGDEWGMNGTGEIVGYGDSGGYSRFFIVPKADRAERERGLVGADGTRIYGGGKGNNTRRCRQCGSRTFSPQVWPACGHEDYEWVDKLPIARANVHPTVKPIDLMRHLVRLVTPSVGVVLDPFLGSGTTCLAASEEGLRSIGIERELEYLEIAKGRLMATPMGLGLDSPIAQPRKKLSPGHEPAYRSPHAVDGWGFSSGTSDESWEPWDDEVESPDQESA